MITGGGRPLLRENEIAAANDGAIADHAAVAQRRAGFEQVCAGQRFAFRRRALNIALYVGLADRGVGCAAGNNRKLERIDQQFSLKLFFESGARIDNLFARDRIERVVLKLAHACAHDGQFFQRNPRQFPRHRRRVDLKERKTQLRSRPQKNLRCRKKNARLFRMKRCAPARFGSASP